MKLNINCYAVLQDCWFCLEAWLLFMMMYQGDVSSFSWSSSSVAATRASKLYHANAKVWPLTTGTQTTCFSIAARNTINKLPLCHFNVTPSQSKHQRRRGEPLLLKISLLSLSGVVQLLRESRGLSRVERQEKVYLSSRWEQSCNAVFHLLLRCSIQRGNSPICFPAGKILFGWMRWPQWSRQPVRFMWW